MSSRDFLYSLASRGEYNRLIEYIQAHDDSSVRYGAAGVLLESTDKFKMQTNTTHCKELLTIVLTEPNDSVRAKVLEILLEIEDESILDNIITRLGSSSQPTPTETPYPRILTKWHSSRHYTLRLLAIVGFSSISGRSYLTKLRTSIKKESNVTVLRRAIEEGGNVGDETFVSPIQDYIHMPPEQFQTSDTEEIEAVKKTAIEALVEIGSDASYEALLSATRRRDQMLKEYAIKKIGEFGAKKSLDIVINELDADDEKIQKSAAESVLGTFEKEDDSHEIRMKVLNELSSSADVSVCDQFAKIITSNSEDTCKKRNSAWLLGQLKESSDNTIEALLTAIESGDQYLQKIAAASLYQLDNKDVVEAITQRLTQIEPETPEYNLLTFIKQQIEKDHKKDVIEYTYVTEPTDYP